MRRVWLLANIAVTVALVPALFPGGAGGGSVAVSTIETLPVATDVAPTVTAASVTTTTTVSPPTTTAAPPTTVARKVQAPAPPPTTVPATPMVNVAPAPAAGAVETGKASWYDHRPGICAHKTLPFGTVVTVTHTGNGRSVTCTVGDRGPFIRGWIIDLNPREFEQLAPLSVGVIPVRITW